MESFHGKLPDDLAYQDRLDGKITEEFWVRKSAEWQKEEMQIRESLRSSESIQPERHLNASRISEATRRRASRLNYLRSEIPAMAAIFSFFQSADAQILN